MTTTTLTQLRARLITDLDMGYVLANGATGFSAVSASTLTAAFYLANSNLGGNQWSQWLAFRPGTATAADAVRWISTVTSAGVATISGPNYTDTTLGTETLELYKPWGIRPDWELLGSINQALEFTNFQSWEPLSLAADAAMRETAVASWGTHVNATEAKVTTASKVYPGFIKCLEITNTSANGYLPTANIQVEPGESLLVAALCRTVSGTGCQLILRDVTNSTSDATTLTHSSQLYKLVLFQYTVPAACRNVHVRLGGQGSSDVTDWQALWVLRPLATDPMILPASYADERFKVEAVTLSRFTQGNSTANVYEGLSLADEEMDRGSYSTNFMGPAANPMFVQFNQRNWLTGNVLPWLQLRLPYSERGTFAAESDTTTCPLHLLAPAAIVQLLGPATTRAKVPNGDALYQQALKDFQGASKARITDGPARRVPAYAMTGLRN